MAVTSLQRGLLQGSFLVSWDMGKEYGQWWLGETLISGETLSIL